MRNANIDVGQWVKMKVIGGMALWREKVRGSLGARIDISSCSLDICEVKKQKNIAGYKCP